MKRIYYGWWVVFACGFIQLYFGATFFYGFTALFNPIANEFHWPYALISLAFSFRGLESGALAPVMGIFVDRISARKLLIAGMLIMAVGFSLITLIQSIAMLYTAFAVLALGLSVASPVVTMTIVARWFRQRASLAFGLLACGYAAGGLFVPLLVTIIDRFGWRASGLFFAAGIFVLGIPVSLLVKEPPDGIAAGKDGKGPATGLEGTPSRQALRTRDFWLLSSAVFFGGIAGSALIAHQMPYMVSIGLSRESAGMTVSVLSASNVAGRLLFGWLGDVADKRWCLAATNFLMGIGVLAIAFERSLPILIPSLVFLGLGFGGLVPLRSSTQAHLFGRRAFGAIQGLLMISVTTGSLIAPPFAGWVYDVTGKYFLAWVIMGLVTLIGVPSGLLISGRKSGSTPGKTTA